MEGMHHLSENSENSEFSSLVVVVPAAGVGKRMKSQCPKQYLTIKNQTCSR